MIPEGLTIKPITNSSIQLFFVYSLEEDESPPWEGDDMSTRFYLKVFQGKSCAHSIKW